MLTLDRSKNDTSLMLDLLRAVAAQAVCVGHAMSFFKSDLRPASMPLMQNVGVLTFFLISGLVIGATLWKRSANPDYSFLRFFIDRAARIYTGLLPALAFVVVVDGVTLALTGEPTVARDYNFKTLVANIFMLEGYRGVFEPALRFRTFGSATPLWTLAIEWHIYMFVGALFFIFVQRGSFIILLGVAAFSGQVALHYLTGSFQDERTVGLGLFTLWLAGFGVYFVIRRAPLWLCTAAAIVSALGYAATTDPFHEYDFRGYLLLATAFASIVAASQSNNLLAPARRWIGFFADYSFTLYLTHHTIMTCMFFQQYRGWLPFFVSIAVSNILAIGLAYFGERRHKILASWLYGRVRHARAIAA
jgi:peptidoglycan/LPS O-acetylase OafA/YrhL